MIHDLQTAVAHHGRTQDFVLRGRGTDLTKF